MMWFVALFSMFALGLVYIASFGVFVHLASTAVQQKAGPVERILIAGASLAEPSQHTKRVPGCCTGSFARHPTACGKTSTCYYKYGTWKCRLYWGAVPLLFGTASLVLSRTVWGRDGSSGVPGLCSWRC